MQHITNSTLNEEAWSHASLPVRFESLGIPNVENLTFPAFLGSVNDTEYLPYTSKLYYR
ncbi:unnamed protein product [Ceutorhynchus assimilis]|uniref:Uncharacterized protein n=1 Tax=Ceutorhynchus assimilis TaxID=467358 RepID=A0A9N9QNY7_9CUCU|nr:unnamed protein product [Ceutorhynchus assimilis]